MNELVLRYFYNLAAGKNLLAPVIIFVGTYLGWIMLALVVIIFLRRAHSEQDKRMTNELWFFLSAAAGAWLAAQAIKWLWPLARPFMVLADITPLITADSGTFPSGHAAFFFALASAVSVFDRRFGRWLIAVATAIGLARVMAGIHWPLDILGGLALAAFAVPITLFFFRLFKPGFARRATDQTSTAA